ncbi:MAG TPA: hypothetical protein DEG17_19775 [Cyanobacteria bacterium UBA11149]|nr:hypothetical protein [Cyanobacteria bacterium UBA11367]HBE61054.1 hypothetical protein [Cyanobacteria bacterium UBA11366]HBK62282.1 hypothetical protein [Cyanobacteria bacterium UBA11166]HBR74240.1 hypothetical protein [Cyanobacteria bacterium UBA11159]HBS69863.1 hypothetical protein [Cyanobacteria bacterium UBA11153]HBW91039.1 hypothetical protein [Cyanobacteria bacterium UBA11149]HCA95028.1 hypothetical protein [Cyanobacteria bacterium UBA9226]
MPIFCSTSEGHREGVGVIWNGRYFYSEVPVVIIVNGGAEIERRIVRYQGRGTSRAPIYDNFLTNIYTIDLYVPFPAEMAEIIEEIIQINSKDPWILWDFWRLSIRDYQRSNPVVEFLYPDPCPSGYFAIPANNAEGHECFPYSIAIESMNKINAHLDQLSRIWRI